MTAPLFGRSLTRRALPLLLLGLALLGGLALRSELKRTALVSYLMLGDWREPDHAARLIGDEVLIFDAAQSADRQALQATHGALGVRFDHLAQAVVLSGEDQPGEHEICTRQLPAAWSGQQLLRLELADASGGHSAHAPEENLPLHLTLRLRNRPGWRETAWYLQRSYVEADQQLWEVDLAPLGRFIDPSHIRQLCLSLRATEGNGRPQLALRRMLLTSRWSVDRRTLAQAAVELVALPDGIKLRRFDPLPVAERLERQGVVSLVAARNEVIAFQLAIRRGAKGPATAALTLAPLQGPAGRTLSARLFEQRMLAVRQRSSAMFGPGLAGPGIYPDPLVPLDERLPLVAGNTLVWVDLTVPEDAPPGEYRGQLNVALEGQQEQRPLIVRVLPLTLPHARSLVMIYYLPEILRDHTGLVGEPLARLERAYHRLVHAHGAYLVIDYSIGKLERYLPMLRGSLYAEGPGRGQGAPYWPVNLPGEGKEAMQRAAVEAVRWFAERKLRTQPFIYLADEPGSLADYRRIRERASWIHQAPSPGNQLPVMVTEQVAPEEADWPSLVGSVDYWVSPDNFPEPAASRRQHTRERFFTYNGYEPLAGSQLLDADGISLRTWGWIAFLFEMDMWFLWQGMYYQDIYNKGAPADPYEQPLSFDKRRSGHGEAFGNGDGIIVYPPLPGSELPVASWRLKALRRGVQDRLYLTLADRCGQGQAARCLARRLIPRALGESRGAPTAWPKRPEPWDQARYELQQLLLRCQPDETRRELRRQ